MKPILCGIIILAGVNPLFSAEITTKKLVLAKTKKEHSNQVAPAQHITRALNTIENGLTLFHAGEGLQAKPLLLNGYNYLQKYDPTISSINPFRQDIIYRAVIQTHLRTQDLSANDIDTAIAFAYKFNAIGYNAPAKTRDFLINIASQARSQENYVLADLCHTKALELFEQEWHENKAVNQFECEALYNESEWDYLSYETFLEQMGRSELDAFSLRKEQRKLDKIIKQIRSLAKKGSIPAQCFLIETYINGKHYIPVSHDQAITWCEKFILNLAKLPKLTPLPHKCSAFPLYLQKLSSFNQQVLSLCNYYHVLSARILSDDKEIKKCCSNTQKDCIFPYENIVVKLLSRNPLHLKKILNITPYDTRLAKLDTFSHKLLLQELQSTENQDDLYTTAINHFLTLCALHENELFRECFELEKEYHPRFEAIEKSAESSYAKAMLTNKLNTIHSVHLDTFIKNKKYLQAWEKIYYLMLSPRTRSSACQALINMDAALEDNPAEILALTSQSSHYADIYEMLEQLVTQKDHPACVCHCLGKHYQQKAAQHSKAGSATTMPLKCTAAKHLQCSLAHGRWSDAADLQSACTALTSNMLNYCRQEILKLAALPGVKRLTYESFTIKNILETLSATNTAASDLHVYYNRILHPISTILIPQKRLSLLDTLVETVLADSLYPVSHLQKIASAQATDKDFDALYQSDSILPELITEKLQAFSSNNRAVPNALNSFLGQWNYRSKNYKKAFEHLALCNNHVNDLESQCLLFETHCLSDDIITKQTIQTSLTIIEKILPLLAHAGSNKQDLAAQAQFFNRLTTLCPGYIETLLNQKQYTDAYRLLELIAQRKETRNLACKLLTKVEAALAQESPLLQTQLPTIANRKNVHNRLERFAKKKTHSADYCQCMGNIFAQEAKSSTLDTASTKSLMQKSLDFLQCALEHGNWSETETCSLQKQCTQFAQELSDYRQLYQLQQKKTAENSPALRPLIADLLSYTPANSTFDEIENLIPGSKKLLEFYETDGPLVLPLLLKKLESLNGEHSRLSEALHTIIGLYKYHEEDIPQAREHFTQCTRNEDNLLLQVLKLKTCIVEDAVRIISHIMPRLSIARKSSQPSPQDTFAINMVFDSLNSTCKKHTAMLIEEGKYAETYQLASLLLQEPETHRAGLHTLYAVEEKVVAECDGIESISLPNRSQAYATLEQIAAQSNHNHIVCCCLGNLFHLQSLNQLTSPENCIRLKKEFLKYFRCLLTHDDISQETRNNAQLSCANVAYDLGHFYRELDDRRQAVSYFKQAAEYGRPEAWLTAAKILIKQSSDLANGTEIIDLLDKHAHSNATNRLESCLFLAEQFLDMNTITDKENLLRYLTIAEDCGNYKYAFLLGLLHHNGISIETNNKNGEPLYYLRPDHDKALFYYKKHLELEGNITYPPLWGAVHSPEYLRMITLYRIANILYRQEKMEDAYNYITQAFSSPLLLEEEIGFQTLAGLIQMCATSDSIKPKGLKHLWFLAQRLVELVSTGGITDPITQEEFFPIILMTDRALAAAYNITSKIISTGNDSQESVDWCSTVGYLLSVSTGNKALTDKYRMHSIACLKFAADRGDLAATLRLLGSCEEECSNFEKLYYIETAQNIPNNIQNIMRAKRGEFSPKNIKGQAEFILYCAGKNNPDALKNYCSHMYNYSCPTAAIIEPDLALNLIAQCSQVALVKTNADNFLKSPQKATPEELFSAMLLGSLGSCCSSSSKKELMDASRYLQTIYDLKSPVQRIETQRNLGAIYYKLGWLFSRPGSTNNILLSIAYLEKAAGLHSIDAICLLSRQWLNGVPETKKITKETILAWLQYADALEKTDRTKNLLQEYNKRHPSKIGTATTKPLVIQRTEAELLQQIAKNNTAIHEAFAQEQRERQQKNHPTYPLLVHAIDVPQSIEFMQARDLCNANGNGDLAPLRKLADRQTPDPYACFNLLMFHFKTDKKLETAKKYLRNGIIASIVKPSPKNALFNSHTFLTMIFMVIDDCLLNTKYDKSRRNIMLKEIKRVLVEQNIDSNAFAQMFKFVTNKDISKHPAWK